MAYPAAFHRLALIGSLYADTFATTLSIVPAGGGGLPAVTDALLNSVKTFVADWWNNDIGGAFTGIGIISDAKLTSVKLNRIGTDGKYMDPVTKEWVFTTPIPGLASLATAPQLTLAATIRGSNERALAGRGRMYFPPTGMVSSVQLDGRLNATQALNYAKGFSFFLGGILDAYTANGVAAVPGIASKTRGGAFQGWASVSVGRVVDTMRSRRSKLDEDPQVWGKP